MLVFNFARKVGKFERYQLCLTFCHFPNNYYGRPGAKEVGMSISAQVELTPSSRTQGPQRQFLTTPFLISEAYYCAAEKTV